MFFISFENELYFRKKEEKENENVSMIFLSKMHHALKMSCTQYAQGLRAGYFKHFAELTMYQCSTIIVHFKLTVC